MSTPKELRFFPFENQQPAFRGPGDDIDAATMITDLGDYRACFAAGADYPARGESSPLYLYYMQSAARIRHYIPDAKLIAILRHPADRAYSQFLMKKRDGREQLSFGEALAAEGQRIADGWSHHWHYRQRGFYAAQLKSYFDLFDEKQLRVYLYEDYVTDPGGFMQDIFRFLNVDETFAPDMSVRHNESKIPRNRALQVYLLEPRATKNLLKQFVPAKLSRRIGDRLRRLNLTKPPFPVELRRQLTEVYREDIIQLQDMLRRDLSHWLK
jgi:DNA-binding TFAR19-related protein (PDSD5 family)